MTWSASANIMDISVTNEAWVVGGVLGPFLGGAIDAYKCPADKYLSPAQVKAGYPMRNRSVSMNSFFGRFSTGSDPTASGLNWGFSDMKQFLKQSDCPSPAKTWLVVDEHPDSINDGYFINNATVNFWQDIPASYHNGACGFSFADGHSEIKKWVSASSKYTAVKYVYPQIRASTPPASRTSPGTSLERGTLRPATALRCTATSTLRRKFVSGWGRG